jgi:hypothetical protein
MPLKVPHREISFAVFTPSKLIRVNDLGAGNSPFLYVKFAFAVDDFWR